MPITKVNDEWISRQIIMICSGDTAAEMICSEIGSCDCDPELLHTLSHCNAKWRCLRPAIMMATFSCARRSHRYWERFFLTRDSFFLIHDSFFMTLPCALFLSTVIVPMAMLTTNPARYCQVALPMLFTGTVKCIESTMSWCDTRDSETVSIRLIRLTLHDRLSDEHFLTVTV